MSNTNKSFDTLRLDPIFANVRRRLTRARPALAAAGLVTLGLGCSGSMGCGGSQAKATTSAVVGKVVEISKGATAGVAEGFSEGREAGESVDGAVVVNSYKELDDVGDVSVHALRMLGEQTQVILAIANEGDAPLRVTELRVIALDAEGFAIQPTTRAPLDVTVPPRAKERVRVTFGVGPAQIAAIRVYDHDLTELPLGDTL